MTDGAERGLLAWRWQTRVLPRASRLTRRVLVPLDLASARLTGGRFLVSALVAPGEAVVLHTTGARSGGARDVPLMASRDGDRWLLVGSNFGRARHPAWTTNLLAEPAAELTRRGERFRVTTRALAGDEREVAWRRAARTYPGYDSYATWTDREIRVFEVRRDG